MWWAHDRASTASDRPSRSREPRDATHVFEQWHDRILRRDAAGLSALYADDATIESPLVCRVLDTDSGVVSGRAAIDHFIAQITRRRPGDDELPALFRSGTFLFADGTLIWEYPRDVPGGEDQLDLCEVIELEGRVIRRHRIYWGWRGTEHIIANAVSKAPSS